MKKTTLVSLFAILLVSLLAVGVAAEPIVLKLAYEGEYLLPVAEAFMGANPDVKFEFTQVTLDDFETGGMRLALAAGTGPDIIQVDAAPGRMGLLAEAGLLYPLDSYYEALGWDEKAFQWGREFTIYDGKTWGIAHEVEFIGPLYNVDIFDELGLREPETYEEFVDALRTLKAAGYMPITLGSRDKFGGGWMYSNFLEAAAGMGRVEDVLYGDGRWDQERFNDAAREVQNLVKEGLLLPEANTLTADEALAMLWDGRAAMVITGSWAVGDMITHSDMRLDFFNIPPIGDDLVGRYTGGIGSGFSISAKTAHPDVAAKFLDFALFQPEGQRIIFEEGKVIPAVEADTGLFNIDPIFAQVIDEVNNPRGIGYNLSVVLPAQTKNVYYEAIQGIVGLLATPEQANGMIQSAWEKDKASGAAK